MDLDPAALDYLYRQQDWASVVTVARLELFADPQDDVATLALAAAYAHLEPERAEPLLHDLLDGPQGPWVMLQLAEVERERDPWVALAWLERHREDHPAHRAAPWRDGALARARITVGDYDGGRALLDDPTRALLAERIGSRRPVVGGLASAAVPGLGQALAGEWLEAGSALLVTGGLAAATVWAAREDRAPTAVALGGLTGLFWAGGIYGGADAAVRFNRARTRESVAILDRAGVPGGDPPPLPPPPLHDRTPVPP